LAARRSHLTLLLIVLAALAGVAFLGIPGSPGHRSLREGLDIQGGTEVVLQAAPQKGQTLTSQMMDNSVSIMRTRVDKLGVSEPLITKQGSDQIVIELPAVHDPTQAAKIIGQTAQLELYDLTPSLYGPSIDASQNPVAVSSLFDLLARVQTGKAGAPSAYYLFRSNGKKLVAGPEQSLAALKRDPVVLALKPVQPKTDEGPPGEDDDQDDPAREDDPRLPRRLPGAHRPEPGHRHHLRRRDGAGVPGPPVGPGAGRHLLLPLQARRLPARLVEPVPADDR